MVSKTCKCGKEASFHLRLSEYYMAQEFGIESRYCQEHMIEELKLVLSKIQTDYLKRLDLLPEQDS